MEETAHKKETTSTSPVHRISNRSLIVATLKSISLDIQADCAILIGSRAAQYWLHNFRRNVNERSTDWDIICSSQFLLNWLNEKEKQIKDIEMIIPSSGHDGSQDLYDLYFYCVLNNESKYDFSVPRSSESYTAYLLHHWTDWTVQANENWWHDRESSIKNGSVKLLFVLKKFMLYYSYQWYKTAKDYRQLSTIVDPLTDDDKTLCDLFIKYNERMHGIRSISIPQGSIMEQDEFFQQTRDQQLSLIYRTAMSMATNNDILVGLEKLCTQGPLWFVDFILDHWLAICREKFNEKTRRAKMTIKFSIDNHRLFPDVPELVQQRILLFITDTTVFYRMQYVCKQWYLILHQDSFWRDLYLARYGSSSIPIEDVRSWKIMYCLRLEGKYTVDGEHFQSLVDATIQLRQTRASNIVQLWEDFTHEDHQVEADVLDRLNDILSNSLYVQMQETSDEYVVKLLMIGLDDRYSRTSVELKLNIGEYGSSRYTDYMEKLSISLKSAKTPMRLLDVFGPSLFGFYLVKRGYYPQENTLLNETASALCAQFPSGLLLCLFIVMTHPNHRAQFIEYLKKLEYHCSKVYKRLTVFGRLA